MTESAHLLSQLRPAVASHPFESTVVNLGESERWLSLTAGGALTCLGIRRGRLEGLLAIGIGAGLVYRGLTGHCHLYQALGIETTDREARFRTEVGVPAQQGVKIEQTMVIQRPAADLFSFWKKLEQLPDVFQHLKSVQPLDNGHSHWVAQGPFNTDIQWDAEIINERPNQLIAWCSLPDGEIETAGSVHFRPLDAHRATELTISLKYNPPAGQIGAAVASWLGVGLEQTLAADLERFRHIMESPTEREASHHAPHE